ncbi:peptide/nickel transport system ATP-binding protein/oligopeptide transport system ATP-binding protein [Parelusimicrobium proximum]|uniref:ABC transporter ATP-binding protein n=1 Tax=Parelusimicrobium proximum TaxID=3228953 RepID=UPI003D16E7DE
MAELNSFLEVKNLAVTFRGESGKAKALKGLSYTLKKGGTLAVVGESGSGKSVHALSILRLLPQYASVNGEILFEGRDIMNMSGSELRALRGGDIAMVFQDPSSALNPILNIYTQIKEVLAVHNICPPSESEETVAKLLTEVGIDNAEQKMYSYPHEFSGGQRQRIMIAMALAGRPKLLIADEPTTALDVTIQAQIMELLARIQKDRGMALIFITHNLALASQIAEEVLVLYSGLAVEKGGKDDVFGSPRHPYTCGLMGSVPDVDNKAGKLLAIEGTAPSAGESCLGCAFEPRCKKSMEKCKTAAPALYDVNGVNVRCFLFDHDNRS